MLEHDVLCADVDDDVDLPIYLRSGERQPGHIPRSICVPALEVGLATRIVVRRPSVYRVGAFQMIITTAATMPRPPNEHRECHGIVLEPTCSHDYSSLSESESVGCGPQSYTSAARWTWRGTMPAGTGLLVSPDDVAVLAQVLRRLIGDRAERQRLATNARAEAAQLPTWQDSARLFADAIEIVGAIASAKHIETREGEQAS